MTIEWLSALGHHMAGGAAVEATPDVIVFFDMCIAQYLFYVTLVDSLSLGFVPYSRFVIDIERF